MGKYKIAYLLIMVVLLSGMALVISMNGQAAPTPPVDLPAPLPKVQVKGWTNTDEPPTSGELEGKWLLVDCWATWCGPCIAAMPELVAFRKRWPEDEVAVIGVTDKSSGTLEEIQDKIDSIDGFDWPVVCGGEEFLKKFNNPPYPTLILFNPEGKVVDAVLGSIDEATGLSAVVKIETSMAAGMKTSE